jgi:Saxitoxin biosynthesis operon protein SxtJ
MATEDLTRQHTVEGSSNRSFGLVFASVFFVIALWPFVFGRGGLRWWAAIVATVFALLALAAPAVLAAPNRAWMKLGLLLGRIVSPIVLGIMFFAVFTPMGWVLRAMGKDPMRLKRDAAAPTYWIERKPPGPPPESLNNQF